MKNKIVCFTHSDLDGVVSGLVVKWFNPTSTVDIIATSIKGFRNTINSWLLNNHFSEYDAVYITDLDVIDDVDLIDKPEVIVIDHHKSHEPVVYKHAVKAVKEYSSAALLAYKILHKQTGIELTKEQKTLVLLANDYDSYTLAIPESAKLNAIFHRTQNKIDSFLEQYKSGFTGFTREQNNIYALYTKALNKAYKDIECFQNTNIKIGSSEYNVCAVFATEFFNEIADYILENLKCDVVFIVNVEDRIVSIRRSSSCTLPLHKLAERLIDGGGHEYAAGGTLTDNFLEFTKQLSPVFTG